MFNLVYVSSAVTPFSADELAGLLAVSHRNNTALDITGMLLYKDGNMMQVLEGDEDAVRKLYAKIGRDPRHRGVLTLVQGQIDRRRFPDWSMGFRDLDTSSDIPPGYSEFMNSPLTGEEFLADPTRSQRLLLTFKKSM